MGTRSMNYIALQPGVKPSEAFKKFMDSEAVLKDERGTLIVYESNFAPMWSRSGENCTFDLEEEIVIQKFLGSLPNSSYYMKRAGDICDWRGDWKDHPFSADQEVKAIDANYQAAVGEYQDGLEVEYPNDYTVRVELRITAESPEEAAQFALNDLRDTSMSNWNMDVSSSRGTKTVSVDASDAPAMA